MNYNPLDNERTNQEKLEQIKADKKKKKSILRPFNFIKNIKNKKIMENNKKAMSMANERNVGCIRTFGSYYINDKKNKQPIEWLILDLKQNSYRDEILLISKYAIDCKRYNDTETNVTWEKCSLRRWLNNEFLNEAFSKVEQAQIISNTVPASPEKDYINFQYVSGGNSTIDKVFILSNEEAKNYFSYNDSRKCYITRFTKKNGGFTDKKRFGFWWLRTPGSSKQNCVSLVVNTGDIYEKGAPVNSSDCCVRPAIWIEI